DSNYVYSKCALHDALPIYDLKVNILRIPVSFKFDHALGEIDNLYGFPHVEYKYFPAISHGSGLQHQLAGLRNCHKIACYVGMRQRQRTAALHLFFKQWNDRSVRYEHITKPGNNKIGLAAGIAGIDVDFRGAL